MSAVSSVEAEARRPQVLTFTEPASGTTVVLVGCMHYNPASIACAREVTRAYADAGTLAAVLVESCATRWEAGAALRAGMGGQQRAFYEALLANEMQAAAEVAAAAGAPLVLCDQPIETTGARVQACLADTLRDLADVGWATGDGATGGGGWGRIRDDLARGWRAVAGTNPGEGETAKLLTLADFTDPALLANMPVSLVRYPAGLALRFPLFFAAAAAVLLSPLALETALASTAAAAANAAAAGEGGGAPLLFPTPPPLPLPPGPLLGASGLAGGLAATAGSLWSGEDTAESLLFSVCFSLFEIVVFGRALLVPILAERNDFIARSVADQCLEAQQQQGAGAAGGGVGGTGVEGAPETAAAAARVVVAVLGMAHCNGVRELLEAGDVQEGGGRQRPEGGGGARAAVAASKTPSG